MDHVAQATRWVWPFADGSKDMRDLLGGKGANVAEMTRILGPEKVPAGFTITTEACVAYMDGDRELPDGLAEQVAGALADLEEQAGKKLGDPQDPLLVSVRSGARESMPGMLDTVLNLGLNDRSVEGLAERTDNPRFAWDSYRRFVQMYGNVVVGIAGSSSSGRSPPRRPRAGCSSTRTSIATRWRSSRAPSSSCTPSRRSPRSSSTARSGRCSTPGRASARCPTGASTGSRTRGARRCPCSRWCSATRARRRGPGWRSRATR
jgi:hypothetical protein